MLKYRKNPETDGYTLVELMIVVAIIGVLAMMATPMYINILNKVKSSDVVSDLGIISDQIEDYYAANGAYPDSLADVGLADMKDPWGNPYQYLNITTAKGKGKLRKDRNLVPINTDFDLYSMGPDGKTASPLTAKNSLDDIVRAGNGSFMGVAADF